MKEFVAGQPLADRLLTRIDLLSVKMPTSVLQVGVG
jgi:hypothetical protein